MTDLDCGLTVLTREELPATVTAARYLEYGMQSMVIASSLHRAKHFKELVAEIMDQDSIKHRRDYIRHKSGGLLQCRTHHPLSEGHRGMCVDVVFLLDSDKISTQRKASIELCAKENGMFVEVR